MPDENEIPEQGAPETEPAAAMETVVDSDETEAEGAPSALVAALICVLT